MTGINDFEIPRYVFKLMQFLGTGEINRLTKSIKKADKFNGSLERIFFLHTRHPWALGLCDMKKLMKKPTISKTNITKELSKVGTDAAMFLPILKSNEMPKKTLKQFRRRLCDPKRGKDAIFELSVAHRFFNLGSLTWIENTNDAGAEFDVTMQGQKIRIECKAMEADTGRKFARKDFYRLADIVGKHVFNKSFKGEIHFRLTSRLPSSQDKLQEVLQIVSSAIDKGQINHSINHTWCSIELKLDLLSGIAVGQNNLHTYVKSVIPDRASAGLFCRSLDGADPLVISITADQPTNIVKKMLDKISSTKKQIGRDSLGAVYLYLPAYTVGELDELHAFQPFAQTMNNYFKNRAPSNLVAIVLLSGPFNTPTFYGARTNHEALVYKNQKFKNQPIYDFKFVDFE